MADAPTASTALRPIERRIRRLHAEGYDHAEIARRFRRSPAAIGRIMTLSAVTRPGGGGTGTGEVLRPLERRVLRWLDAGIDHAEIGFRFRRHPAHIRRVEALALVKLRDPARWESGEGRIAGTDT